MKDKNTVTTIPTASYNSNQYLNQDNTLIFLHIPKNAGTSLRKIVERFYSKENIYFIYTRASGFHDLEDLYALSDAEMVKIRIFMGHVSFGLHKIIPKPCTYVTILRNPIDRIVSLISSYTITLKSCLMNTLTGMVLLSKIS